MQERKLGSNLGSQITDKEIKGEEILLVKSGAKQIVVWLGTFFWVLFATLALASIKDGRAFSYP